MFLCSLIEELCTKKENDKTCCNFNFGHEFMLNQADIRVFMLRSKIALAVSFERTYCDKNFNLLSNTLRRISKFCFRDFAMF